MGIAGAAIGAGADILGGIMSGSGSAAQRGWEARMSDTAYQRAVHDMKLAGLNPMMMFKGGAGPETSPSGTNPGEAIGAGVASAGGRVLQAMAMKADIEQKRASAKNTTADTLNKAATGANILADTNLKVGNLANVQKTGQTILPMASSSMMLQAYQAGLANAQQGRVPYQIALDQQNLLNLAAQQKLTTAQAAKTQVETARAGEGFLGSEVGPQFLDLLWKKWHELVGSENQAGPLTSPVP